VVLRLGALIGEALIFTSKKLDNIIPRIKRQGALLAKGRLLGIQFDTLFTDNLYFEISKHAIKMANLLKNGLLKKGVKLYIDSPTNQQFIILENYRYEKLKQHLKACYWGIYDTNHVVVRLTTSWATKEEDVIKLIELV